MNLDHILKVSFNASLLKRMSFHSFKEIPVYKQSTLKAKARLPISIRFAPLRDYR